MEVLQRTANRGSIATDTGYDITNSLKFEPDNSEILKRTYGSGGTVQKWTFSTWIKRTELVGCRLFGLKTNGNVFLQLSGDKLRWYVNGNDQYTEAVYRDTAAWYHIILQFDTTQATASNRTKIYVNGVQQTLTGSYVGQNTSAIINSAVIHGLGGREDNNTEIFAGYMAETYFIDNQALEPSDFGEYDSDSGIWKPKEYEGTFGTTGWYLDFEDAANLGDDVSGNNNHWTETNITSADQATDTPTNNFCTGNNLVRFTNPSSTVVVDGATFMQKGANGRETISGTMYASSGKWYAEVQPIYPTGNNFLIGVMPSDSPIIYLGGQITNFPGSASGDGGVSYISTGNKYLDGGNSSYGNAYSSGASVGPVIGIALDMDNGKVYFSISNVWQNSGDPTSGATGTGAIDLPSPEKSYSFHASIYNSGNSVAINYGGYTYFTISSGESDANGYGTFEYAPPSGYYALCTKNLEEFG